MKLEIQLLPYKVSKVYVETLNLFLAQELNLLFLSWNYQKFLPGKKIKSPKFRNLSYFYIISPYSVMYRLNKKKILHKIWENRKLREITVDTLLT